MIRKNTRNVKHRQLINNNNGTTSIPLTKGQFALVDNEDLHLVEHINWQARKSVNTFYANATRDKITFQMHRIIMGVCDPKVLIDHIDGNGLNNTKKNLRLANERNNCFNRRKRKDSAVSFKGVWKASANRYRAEIVVNKKRHYLGCFKDSLSAAEAYNKAAIEHFGEFAQLNATKEITLQGACVPCSRAMREVAQ